VHKSKQATKDQAPRSATCQGMEGGPRRRDAARNTCPIHPQAWDHSGSAWTWSRPELPDRL